MFGSSLILSPYFPGGILIAENLPSIPSPFRRKKERKKERKKKEGKRKKKEGKRKEEKKKARIGMK